MTNKIHVKDVYKIYQSGTLQQRIETVALRGISLDIYDHDFITVMGPSGSGKTTLLNVLGGLDTPSAGDIVYELDGQSTNITNLNESQLDAWRHDKIGVVFQADNLIHHLTALENVELPLKFLGIKDLSRAEEILTRLGLGDRLHHRTHQLSAGERQRVALAAALVFKPKIILADEPTGELDSSSVRQTMELFKELHQEENIIFFLVTHNPIVASYGTRYFTLEDGYLQEREEPFSYDDFSSVLGEFVIKIDKFSRLVLPHDLVRDLNPSENMVGIQLVTNDPLELVITNDIEDKDIEISQLDSMNRILLPKDLMKQMKLTKKPLIGVFDEENNHIIIRRKQQ
ncbi:MAG: ABC transporter ATP-binding protein [Candidatus Hodarchaeales archaeon]